MMLAGHATAREEGRIRPRCASWGRYQRLAALALVASSRDDRGTTVRKLPHSKWAAADLHVIAT